MGRYAVLFTIGVTLSILAGCATVKDVQRATDLIRTDNELTRLLVEVRPHDPAGAATYLNALAAQAKDEADALRNSSDSVPDAIAYYRIASTAYWRSGREDIANNLFEVTENGTKLCTALGDKAPDRDCMFLQLVIPFAGLESIASNENLATLLDKVYFGDKDASKEDIENMMKVYRSLVKVRPLVQKILSVTTDNRYLSHSGMRDYYCGNAQKAVDYYDGIVGAFRSKVRVLSDGIPAHRGDLDITDTEIEALKLSKGVPDFCPKGTPSGT
jgi:hypothetical protein